MLQCQKYRIHAPNEPLNVAAVGGDGFLDSSGIMGRRAGETAAGEPAKLSPWDVALRRRTLLGDGI